MHVIGGSVPSICIFLGELVCSWGDEHGETRSELIFRIFIDCYHSIGWYAVAAGSL